MATTLYHTREDAAEREDFLQGSSRHPDYYHRNFIEKLQDWWHANPIKRKVYLSVGVTLLVLLVVLVLVIFFLSPRDPELIFNSASGVSLSFAPFKLSLKENFLLDNPNYVTLDVKLFTGAVYYNDTSLAEWDLKPSTISMRDDKKFVIPVSVVGPQAVADAIEKECATADSFTLRVDGFVGVNFMFYDDFWRTAYLRKVPCPKATNNNKA